MSTSSTNILNMARIQRSRDNSMCHVKILIECLLLDTLVGKEESLGWSAKNKQNAMVSASHNGWPGPKETLGNPENTDKTDDPEDNTNDPHLQRHSLYNSESLKYLTNCKFIRVSHHFKACETKFYLSYEIDFMSYEMTNWNKKHENGHLSQTISSHRYYQFLKSRM